MPPFLQVVRVNQQWAVDYDQLHDSIASTKTSVRSSSGNRSDVLMSPSSERCFECYMSGRGSGHVSGRGSREGVECEQLKKELSEIKARLEAIKRERDRAMDENRAVQYQVSFVFSF